MSRLIEIYEAYGQTINFRFVYILEAHAQDEWPISSARCSPTEKAIKYNQTHTIEDRLIVARDFIVDFNFPMPVVLDTPDENLFDKYYASWPVRIYILDENFRLTYKAQPSETMLDMKEFIDHLDSIQKRNQ